MKVFVWNRIENCTINYHCEGGVVVFALNEERARALFAERADKGCMIAPDEKPDYVRDVAGGDEAVYIMPDAGCC